MTGREPITEPASVPSRRLRAQRLTGEPFASPVDALRWFGAVQSQDYGAAKWALGQRTRASADADIDRLYDEGRILRTHVLRPTWHFVLPEDAGWLLALTGPRVRRGVAGRHRRLELDEHTIGRSHAAVSAALAGHTYLTRPELGTVIEAAGIVTDGQRLPHLLLAAELDGLIISGPRRGRAFTYALLDERAPSAQRYERDVALAELARRYFSSRGPAQLQDFAWWSGLSRTDARLGIDAAGAALHREMIAGSWCWSAGDAADPGGVGTIAHLLPNFDEYTVAYRDRTALHQGRRFDPTLFAFGSILSNVVTVDGVVRGAWRPLRAARAVTVRVRLLRRMNRRERMAVSSAAERLGAFLGRAAQVEWAEATPPWAT